MRVHFREQYGTKGNEILYVTPDDQNNIVRVPLKSDKIIIKEQNTFSRIFQEIFLPHGFPDSVSDDYLTYQIWDTIQAFCSTISGGCLVPSPWLSLSNLPIPDLLQAPWPRTPSSRESVWAVTTWTHSRLRWRGSSRTALATWDEFSSPGSRAANWTWTRRNGAFGRTSSTTLRWALRSLLCPGSRTSPRTFSAARRRWRRLWGWPVEPRGPL